MEFKCLGTGSSGNCYLVKLGSSTIILDAGVDIKKITNEVNLNNVSFAFISHKHQDHSKSQNSLVQRGVEIVRGINQTFTKNATKSKFGENLRLYTFPVEHGECENYGLIIQTDAECILYVTDFTNCIYDLSPFKFTSVIVECNFLEENVTYEGNEISRVLENIKRHQSLHGCDLFLSGLDLTNCKEIILIHFSENYSDPIYMGSFIYNKYKIKTLCCKKYGGYDTYE